MYPFTENSAKIINWIFEPFPNLTEVIWCLPYNFSSQLAEKIVEHFVKILLVEQDVCVLKVVSGDISMKLPKDRLLHDYG